MQEQDPGRLADELEGETADLQHRSDRLGGQVDELRQDWQHKRADPSVPGAPPPDDDGEQARAADEPGEASGSPGSEAPPQDAGPGAAEEASEGQAGPPADSGQE